MFLRSLLVAAAMTVAATPSFAQRWVTSWSGPSQGPYPSGNPTAQPDLQFAFPDKVAHDQTFRLIVRPTAWGKRARLRFSNVFGTEPLVVDGVYAGLQMSGAAVAQGSNRPVTFKNKKMITIAPGADAWSDAVTLPFVGATDAPELQGRKLAVSFHVVGDVKAMTWHAKALQTSYVTLPGAGSLGELEDESAYPNSTTSWYFLDAVDMQAAPEISAVVCLGDSITDGTDSTLNGDDRWPDVLARRLTAAATPMAVVNAGIGGNQVVGPAQYGPDKPFAGGPSALARLDRDVLALSGVTHVIWLEGINDFSANGNASFDAVRDGMKEGGAGRLVFVTVKHLIEGPGGLAIEEEQDIVYRGMDGAAVKPGAAVSDRLAPGDGRTATVRPDPVLLFRYSALTGNGHRIHYDLDYVRDVEGYPGLIVHGPLQATWLAGLLQDRPLRAFRFRGQRPAFHDRVLSLEARMDAAGAALRSLDEDGAVCMQAEAEFA